MLTHLTHDHDLDFLIHLDCVIHSLPILASWVQKWLPFSLQFRLLNGRTFDSFFSQVETPPVGQYEKTPYKNEGKESHTMDVICTADNNETSMHQ